MPFLYDYFMCLLFFFFMSLNKLIFLKWFQLKRNVNAFFAWRLFSNLFLHIFFFKKMLIMIWLKNAHFLICTQSIRSNTFCFCFFFFFTKFAILLLCQYISRKKNSYWRSLFGNSISLMHLTIEQYLLRLIAAAAITKCYAI